MGQQRQCPRLVLRVAAPGGRRQVGEQQRDESLVYFSPGQQGGPHHGVAHLARGHRPEHHVPLLQGLPQPGVADRLAVEIGPQREDDQHAAGQLAQDADQHAPLVLVVAEGEESLELVDDDRPARPRVCLLVLGRHPCSRPAQSRQAPPAAWLSSTDARAPTGR